MTDVVEIARGAPSPHPAPAAAPAPTESASSAPVAGERAAQSLRPSAREIVAVIGWGCTIFGIAVLCFGIYLVGITRLEHARSQRSLAEQFDEALAVQDAPVGGRIDEGTPVAAMSIEKFGVDEMVVEGTSGEQLTKGPGHFRASPLPGQQGNAVIACRRVTFGSPCWNLTDLRRGDEISFVTGQGEVEYRVSEVRGVKRGDTDVLANTSDDRLTLITSERFAASRRVAVIATMRDDPFRGPDGRATEVRSSELGLNTDGSNVLAIVLWLQVLLVVCLLAVWLLRRQRRVSVYLVTAPVVLLLALLVFDSITMLLPSTL